MKTSNTQVAWCIGPMATPPMYSVPLQRGNQASVLARQVLALGLLLSASSTALANVNSCVAIKNDALRLACYDELFKGHAAQFEDVVSATSREAKRAMQGRAAPAPDANVDVNGRVTRIHKTLRNELLVELDNGQTWQQTSPRLMSISEGDEVIVRKARLGGYILSTSRGSSTRVKQKD